MPVSIDARGHPIDGGRADAKALKSIRFVDQRPALFGWQNCAFSQ
jgi:hypothetical protein